MRGGGGGSKKLRVFHSARVHFSKEGVCSKNVLARKLRSYSYFSDRIKYHFPPIKVARNIYSQENTV